MTKMARTVLLGPAGIQILLPPLGRTPVRRDGVLLQELFIPPGEVLLGSGHQSHIHDLPRASFQTLGTDLSIQLSEECRHPGRADAVFKVPDGRMVRNVRGMLQTTEALETAANQELKLGLIVGQSMQPLDHQDSHHGLGGIGGGARP